MNSFNEGKKVAKKQKNRGVILSFFFWISDEIAKALKNSFIGYIFADLYLQCNKQWKNGFVYKFFKPQSTFM